MWPIYQEDVTTRFADAYGRRLSEFPMERRDPAIRECLDLLDAALTPKVAQGAVRASTVDEWLAPFRRVTNPEVDPMPSEYQRLAVKVTKLSHFRTVEIQMGAATRLVVLNGAGERLKLPSEFSYQSPWSPAVYEITPRLLLVSEDSIQDAGMRSRVRLVLLKVAGKVATKVGAFTANTTLDYGSVTPKGRSVEVVALRSPKGFRVSSADPILGVRYRLRCGDDSLATVSQTYLQPALVAVDQAIAEAWRAISPTKLERTIRAAIPAGEPLDDIPKISHIGRGQTQINFGPLQFVVSPDRRVIGFRRTKGG